MAKPDQIIQQDPDVLGGRPVFAGTRVPVSTLWEYLSAGESLDVFLEHFPTVTRQQALAVLKQANDLLVSHAAAD
jgi:uncharacterized protein (DUF433 family)